jgi:hypothetical protein
MSQLQDEGYYLGRDFKGNKCLVIRKEGEPASGYMIGPSRAGETYDPTGEALKSQYRISGATFIVLMALLVRIRRQRGIA